MVTAGAAAGGHLDCLQYLHESGCPWDELTCACAADKQDPSTHDAGLRCLRYALDQGLSWGDAMVAASLTGNMEVLRYAHEHDCPWHEYATWAAASAGHLTALEFLYERYVLERGCAWSARTLSAAAYGGHLACLRYAHEHGCLWDRSTVLDAFRGGHWECAHYAHKHGNEVLADDALYIHALQKGNSLDAAKRYAEDNGFQWLYDLCLDAEFKPCFDSEND
jgi:hypothetical protein